jgi:hypothetical protein
MFNDSAIIVKLKESWQDTVEENTFLDLVSYRNMRTRCDIFTKLKTSAYKVPVAAGCFVANDLMDFFRDYVKRNIKKVVMYAVDTNYIQLLQKVIS